MAWWVAGDWLRVNPLLIPKIATTSHRLVSLFLRDSIALDLGWTAWRWLSGYSIAVAVGIPLGVLLGSSRRLYDSLEFLIEFFRSLPVTALFPLYLLIWGITGDASKRAMVFTAAVFPVLLASISGTVHASHNRAQAARTLGANPLQIFWSIRFFEALPSIAVGARTALSTALIVAILTELWIGTEVGIGARLFEAYSRSATPDLYAILLIVGFLGYSTNKLCLMLESRLIFWTGK